MAHCDDALRTLYDALRSYAAEHDGRYPARLEMLVDAEVVSPWLLVCPAGGGAIGESSYTYRGCDLFDGTDRRMVIAYDREPWHRGRRNILLVGGEVIRPTEREFEKLIVRDNRLRPQFGLPEKATDP